MSSKYKYKNPKNKKQENLQINRKLDTQITLMAKQQGLNRLTSVKQI
jgi:hypothetical protein